MSAKMLNKRMRTSYAVTKITVHKKEIQRLPCGDAKEIILTQNHAVTV
jgi:hypothetical protein